MISVSLALRTPVGLRPTTSTRVDAGIDQALAQHTLPDHAGRAENDDTHRDVPTQIAAHAAAAISSKDTPVSVAETSHSLAEEAKSFARGMILAATGGPFNS